LALVLLLLALAPVLPLPDPNLTDPARRLLPPGSEGAILGTDQLGRDLLARLLSGTAVSLGVGLSATLAAAVVGSAIGLVAGYAGGWADGLLMRGVDLVMAFPYILLALAIVAILGPGLMNALYAVAIVNVPFFARNVRGAALVLARREFVDAARLSGASTITILFVELLPNLLPTIVVAMSTTMGWMILETAGLSFLGLGAQPPQADLGAMLGEGRKLLFTAPHVTAIPGAMILVLTIAINLLGDGVRDLLDPRLRRGALAAPGAATETGPDVASPPPHDGRLLDVRGLSVRFPGDGGAFKAVDGLDLD
ncbi:MAG: ABC transporter permease subunit, partial [Alphaproteobacteria bacterium]